MPSFNEHSGILPPPVNIPPMMTTSPPIRKHPHHSTTARIPFGLRLAGRYGRSGHRGPWNKPVLQNGETAVVADGGWSGPRIMNPNAAEFLLGQPWPPNGNPTSPNSEVLGEGESIEDIGNVEVEMEKQNVEVGECADGKKDEVGTLMDSNPVESSNSEAPIVVEENGELERVGEKPGKCWADYSDGEPEIVGVVS